jgi:hypothetical protein
MAIDIRSESILSLNNAAKVLPRRRQGKKPHFSTVWRWAMKGCRGVRLETIRVGGTLCTSREALQRFFDQLSAPDGVAVPVQPYRTPAARLRQQRQAEIELDAEGL